MIDRKALDVCIWHLEALGQIPWVHFGTLYTTK